jgi:hypothetical protein
MIQENPPGPFFQRGRDADILWLPLLKENIQISRHAFQVLERFEEEMTIEDRKPRIYFHREGNLFLVGEQNLTAARRAFDLQRSLGCRIETTSDSWKSSGRNWPSSCRPRDRLKLVRGRAGLYDVNTLDGNAIPGEWPEIKGLYLATGFSGHGLQPGPAVGRYLSELILQRPVSLDLSIFTPQRILDKRALSENGIV